VTVFLCRFSFLTLRDSGQQLQVAVAGEYVVCSKGTMSEAELHVLRARLLGGIRNKAARGELRRGLPVGFVWGDADGDVRFHPDEAVCGMIRTVFSRFSELGSARRVWLWLRTEGLLFPMRPQRLTAQ
jgi:hypothetical protein